MFCFGSGVLCLESTAENERKVTDRERKRKSESIPPQLEGDEEVNPTPLRSSLLVAAHQSSAASSCGSSATLRSS